MDLNDPTTVVLLTAEALDSAGFEYALYGGLLTAVYGEPRETRDADVAVTRLTASEALRALQSTGLQAAVAFETVIFGGLELSRVTVFGNASNTGLNTIDLVRPRSGRYAEVAVKRAVVSTLRDQRVRLLTLEDFILFKVLSTRDRDLEDARSAIERSGSALDEAIVSDEVSRLAGELPDVDVRGRWSSVRRES